MKLLPHPSTVKEKRTFQISTTTITTTVPKSHVFFFVATGLNMKRGGRPMKSLIRRVFFANTNRLAATAAGSASLQELTFLAAARRSAGASGASHLGVGLGAPSSGPADLHPAYRLNPYVEHLYSSLHSSPTASLRGLSPLDPRGKHHGCLVQPRSVVKASTNDVQLGSHVAG